MRKKSARGNEGSRTRTMKEKENWVLSSGRQHGIKIVRKIAQNDKAQIFAMTKVPLRLKLPLLRSSNDVYRINKNSLDCEFSVIKREVFFHRRSSCFLRRCWWCLRKSLTLCSNKAINFQFCSAHSNIYNTIFLCIFSPFSFPYLQRQWEMKYIMNNILPLFVRLSFPYS